MTGPKVRMARWLLLCALAFGVVGMHHLGVASHHDHGSPTEQLTIGPAVAGTGCCADHAGADGHGMPGPLGLEGLLHLCLAVLAAAMVLAALLVRWRRLLREPWPSARLSWALRWRSPRAPPDSATVLASLGVLRL